MSIWTVAVVALATLAISLALHGDAYCDDDAGNLCGLQPHGDRDTREHPGDPGHGVRL